jgi:hypothetical protein
MDDDLGPLRESARSPSQEKCASKCVRGIVLSAFIYFLARNEFEIEIRESDLSSVKTDLESGVWNLEIWNLEFEI